MSLDDFNKMKQVSANFSLSDWFDTVVDIFLDEKSGKAFQVDKKHKRFREADGKIGGQYGDWKPIS